MAALETALSSALVSVATVSEQDVERMASHHSVGVGARQILSLSTRFYTLVPHVLPLGGTPPLLNSLALVREKIQMIETMRGMHTHIYLYVSL